MTRENFVDILVNQGKKHLDQLLEIEESGHTIPQAGEHHLGYYQMRKNTKLAGSISEETQHRINSESDRFDVTICHEKDRHTVEFKMKFEKLAKVIKSND